MHLFGPANWWLPRLAGPPVLPHLSVEPGREARTRRSPGTGPHLTGYVTNRPGPHSGAGCPFLRVDRLDRETPRDIAAYRSQPE